MRISALFLVLALAAMTPALAHDDADGEKTDIGCSMKFNLKGWSAFYKTAKGTGTVTCDNGQSAEVAIKVKGGGLTVGKSEIADGKGSFSEVHDISEVFGAYASVEAHAGAVKSSSATALTKGEISLAISGVGRGWDLGVSFGRFVIKPKK